MSHPRPRWYQFSLKRLLIVAASGPPLLAGLYFIARETVVGALLAAGLLIWILLIVDLLRNRAISTNGKIVWLLMMTLSCSIFTLLYAAVRIHDWLVCETSEPVPKS